jgi:hypothetical protein
MKEKDLYAIMKTLIEESFMASLFDLDKLKTVDEIIEHAAVCGDSLALFVLRNISETSDEWDTPQEAWNAISGIMVMAIDDLENIQALADENSESIG